MVKIERSTPAPESLSIEKNKANGSYSQPDVVKRLKQDFYDKCYICGLDNLPDIQVEHLLPHMNGKYPERKFDWNNLFLSCPHCNGVKNKRKYDVGILNCCITDPEIKISFRLEDERLVIQSKKEGDDQAALTAELVREVFEQNDTGIRTHATQIRYNELCREMNKLYDNLEGMRKKPDSKYYHRKLQALLQRKSRFAAFKREYVRMHSDVYPELMQYLV